MMCREFTTWLEDEMSERDMNQAELARKGGISHGRVSQVLTLGQDPGWDFIAATSRALNLPLAYVAHMAGLWPEYRDDPRADAVHDWWLQLPDQYGEHIYDLMRDWVERHGRRGNQGGEESEDAS